MVEESILSDEELKEAADLIRSAAPGLYTLKQLYGSAWKSKLPPTSFGTRFRMSVQQGHLVGIVFHEKTSSNHAQYNVL